jgi:cell division protein FtsI/penicillin-binding protein 2
LIPQRFESASGLRLAAAFLLIIAVLGVVALKAAKVTLWDEGEQPRNLKQQRSPEIAFDLVDRGGVPLALSIERMELVAYPNALWQAHTPDQLLPRLAQALGWRVDQLAAALLPPLSNGWFQVELPPFELDPRAAQRLADWIARGSTDPAAVPNPIAGFELRPAGAGASHLWWQPLVVLSREVREQHGAPSTVRWTRRLADELIECVFGSEGKRELESSERELNAARKLVWDALLPLHFKRVMKEVPPETSMRVYQLLKGERVREHQAKLLPVNKRVYPVRQGSAPEAQPVAVLGSWGMLDESEARERARSELHLEDDRDLGPQEELELEARELLRRSYPSPVCGLELLGYQLLQRPEFDWIERAPESYWFLASYVPRRAPQRYFQADEAGDPTPRIVTTLDAGLQRHVRAALEVVMQTHKPALAMAIAIEVASGKVLAVDALDAYAASGFLPTLHTFTPGSTMKVLVMATAVDTNSVDLEQKFDTHNGHYFVDGKREIHEAEGAQSGWLTPAEGLAYSCNAVLVQIGLQIPARLLYERFRQLGYGRAPQAGLGPERAGLIPEWPWDRRFKHASVCIGHEMQVTLWQHAAALATVVRGGRFLPLRLFEAVEQGARHADLPEPGPGEQVFQPATCATVRSMMELGAQIGTGRNVRCPELVMGTKTGTAQKVPDEVCLHAELAYNRDRARSGAPALTRAELRAQKPHRGSCYTASMCAWGHLPDSSREVLVLVVVDEPRGSAHYGSEIAGPAAVSILKEALGYTHGGVRAKDAPQPGFAPLEALAPRGGSAAAHKDIYESRLRALPEQPWGEAGRALR